ncbi:CynX/NimT family MFS transporter [Paenisporosarcina indica]|uniref:MFS transporter n=1 Tax=Paenisporosarcina indica TaxID=650093 RepID=UPI00094F6D8A|nr:MFS transporter [Paenisporosarcina indica]
MQSQKSLISLLIAIFLISLNLRPAITSIGPLLEIIRNDLNLSNSEVSLLTAIPVICMGLFAPLAVHWLNKFGQKRGITILVIIIGVLTLVRAWLNDYITLLITAFVIGVAIAIIGPIMSSLIKERFPTRIAFAIGIYSLGMGAGATLSAGLTGVIYVWVGERWGIALASWASLALLAYLVWMMSMKTQSDEQVNKNIDQQAAFRSPWSNKRAWLILLFFGFQSSLFFSLTTWLASAASELGFSVIQAGSVVSVMTIAQIVSNISLSFLLDKFPNRSFWIYCSLSIGTIGIVLLLTENITLIWTASILLGITLGSLFPLALLLPLDETSDAKEANAWTAMVQTGGFIMGGLVPLAIGILYDWSETHQITYFVMLFLIICMFIVTFLLNKKTLHRQG